MHQRFFLEKPYFFLSLKGNSRRLMENAIYYVFCSCWKLHPLSRSSAPSHARLPLHHPLPSILFRLFVRSQMPTCPCPQPFLPAPFRPHRSPLPCNHIVRASIVHTYGMWPRCKVRLIGGLCQQEESGNTKRCFYQTGLLPNGRTNEMTPAGARKLRCETH